MTVKSKYHRSISFKSKLNFFIHFYLRGEGGMTIFVIVRELIT